MSDPLLYEAVFKASPVGSYLLSTTPEITILDVNESFLRTVSLVREQVVGKRLFDVFPGNLLDPQDSSVEVLRQSIAQAVATGQTQIITAQRYPVAKKLPCGDVIIEERFWSASNTPIYDADGKMSCIYHATIDVTQQVQAEHALRQSERQAQQLAEQAQAERARFQESDERYRLSLEASDSIGTWSVDPETKITVMDARFAQIFGVEPAIAQDGAEIEYFIQKIHPEDRPVVLEAVARAIDTGERFDIDYRIIQASSQITWVTAKGKMFTDENTGKKRFAGVAVDITSRQKIEQTLQDNDRRKDEFLAMLAHELRNPLAPIGAAAQLLQSVKLDEERVRKTSQIIGRQVRHMTSLIDDLLDVSRVTRGLVNLNSEHLDISHVVAGALEQVMPTIHSRDQHLELQMDPGTLMVVGDKDRLIQVIANLLSNAAKFTHEGGNIQIKTQALESDVLIQVIDNGLGMTPELVTCAFDLFTQEERSIDRSSGGLGLGLALVKSLVNLHHGTVVCESPGLGKGSTLTLRLPRIKAKIADDYIGEATSKNGAPRDPLRIMVVDDNVDAASMLAMLLETYGHEVLVEHRSHRALERAKTELPQVFLLDIGLPELDGNEMAKHLRAQPETENAVLIAVTGYGQEHDRLQTQAAGFNHHLVKPVDAEKLIAILAEVVNF